jgi:dolichol kinase
MGLRFGTVKLYKSRTLEGTLAFLAGSLMFNLIISSLIEISFVYIIVGCCIAAITELFSEVIDDNFSVSIVTGGVLAALRYFLPV